MSPARQSDEAGNLVKIFPFFHFHRRSGPGQFRIARKKPHETMLFNDRKGSDLTLWKARPGCEMRNMDTSTVAIVLPAMVGTFNLVVFYQAVTESHKPVRAPVF